jgi:subtilisin family serine protease
MAGTSMSSPVTAGSVALLLEADPTLTPAEVLQYIKKNAIHDSFTGNDLPNNKSGWGKLNIFTSIKDILGVLAVDESPEPAETLTYPNPCYDRVRVQSVGSGFGIARIFNTLGVVSLESECDLSSPEISGLSALSAGAYYLSIISGNKEVFRSKILVGAR